MILMLCIMGASLSNSVRDVLLLYVVYSSLRYSPVPGKLQIVYVYIDLLIGRAPETGQRKRKDWTRKYSSINVCLFLSSFSSAFCSAFCSAFVHPWFSLHDASYLAMFSLCFGPFLVLLELRSLFISALLLFCSYSFLALFPPTSLAILAPFRLSALPLLPPIRLSPPYNAKFSVSRGSLTGAFFVT